MNGRRTGCAILAFAAVLLTSAAHAQDINASDVLIQTDPGAPFRIPSNRTGIQIESVGPPPIVLRAISDVATSDAFASVGRGYDPISNLVKDKACVEPAEPDHQMPVGATLTLANMDVVTDEKSYANVSDSSFGFSVVFKAISFGLGTASGSSSTFNKVGQTARIYSRVVTQSVERRNVRWTDRARSLLSGDERDRAKFVAECGFGYVRAVYSGHMMDQTAEYNLNAKQNTASSATELEVGVKKIFGAAASSSEAETAVNTITDFRWRNRGVGTYAAPPAPLPGKGAAETMIAYYNTGFVPAVRAAKPTEALPLYLTIENYRQKNLPLVDRIPVWIESIMKAVEDKVEDYNTLVTIISDLEYATKPGLIDRLSVFYAGTALNDANTNLVRAKAMLTSFQQAVLDCQALMINGREILPGNTTALKTCTDRLMAALPAGSLEPLKLKRKFS